MGEQMMNRDDLKNYKYDKQWTDEQLKKYNEMLNSAIKITSTINGLPKAKNKTNYHIEEILDNLNKILAIVKEDEKKCIEILKQLRKMKNKQYRNVLYYRYIKGMSLEKIADLIGYNYYDTCKFNGKALNEFDELGKNDQSKNKIVYKLYIKC